jgi:hypothetical protein
VSADDTATTYITEALDRAQANFTASVDPAVGRRDHRQHIGWFVQDVVAVVLLENLRRLNPALADRLTDWVLSENGIFDDGYAGELLHEWREQIAAGQPLDPIGPESSEDGA